MTMTIEAGTLDMADGGDKEHKELIRQERVIARKYMGKFPLAMAIWGLVLMAVQKRAKMATRAGAEVLPPLC